MFDSVILDVVIGLVFVYLLYSLLATIIQEMIATNFGFRAKILQKGVMRMLDDGKSVRKRFSSFMSLFFGQRKNVPPLTKEFYEHPLIKYLGQDKWHSKPSYLSAQNFSKVMVDLLRGKQTTAGADHSKVIEEALTNGKTKWAGNYDQEGQAVKTDQGVRINDETKDFLMSIWVDAQGDIDKFRVNLEDWYNETMDRVSGWYKQYTQVILLIVGLFIATIFNVDTLAIVKKLEKDPKLREQLVQQADAFAKAHPNLLEELKADKEKNEKLISDLRAAETQPQKLDSLGKSLNKASQVNYDSLRIRRDTLFARATRLMQGDIGKMNNVLAIGWGNYGGATGFWCKVSYVFCQVWSWSKFLGLFLTAIAISLGAPFWFDTLNKLIKLRGAMKGGEEATTRKGGSGSDKENTINRVG